MKFTAINKGKEPIRPILTSTNQKKTSMEIVQSQRSKKSVSVPGPDEKFRFARSPGPREYGKNVSEQENQHAITELIIIKNMGKSGTETTIYTE